MKTRNTATLGIAVLLASVVTVGCGANGAVGSTTGTGTNTAVSSAPASITVAYMPNMGGASSLAVAQQQGYFKKAGLNVQLDNFQTGPAELDAMASGTVNIAYIGPGAIFLAMKGKAKVILVDSISMGDSIVVAPHSGVRTVADLKGKSVLVPVGTTGEIILYEALHSAGLSLDDVNMINTAPSAQVPAFLSNRAPIMAGWDPNTTEAMSRLPGSHILVSDHTYFPNVSLPDVWTVSNQFAIAHPNTVKRFVGAILQAMNYKTKHMSQTVSWTSQLTNVPGPLLQQTISSAVWPTKSQILQDYKSGAVKSWFDSLAKTFVAMKTLPSVPKYSSYALPNVVAQASQLK